MLLPLRYPRAWLALGWLLVAGAILVCLIPGPALPKTGVNDKIEHALAYTVLALWFAGIYPRSRYAHIGAGLLLMGVSIEWAQGAMRAGRESDFLDVLANSGGILFGLIVAYFGLGGWAQRVEAWVQRSPS